MMKSLWIRIRRAFAKPYMIWVGDVVCHEYYECPVTKEYYILEKPIYRP